MKHFIIALLFSFWEYWLGKSKKIIANSTWELVFRLILRFTKREVKMSGFSKIIPVGTAGQIEISEIGGVATVKVSLAESMGGGSMEGVAKASVSAQIDVSAKQIIDAGLELAKVKFPAAASLIDGAKTAIDAELEKI